jgi:replication-associated recombination protein RarA
MSLDSILFADQLVKDDLLMIVNAKIPTNILLHGSNGTGKTMIANQVAKDFGHTGCTLDQTDFSADRILHVLNLQMMDTGLNGLIVIDEVDRIKPEKQYALQHFVDTYCTDRDDKTAICSVILTTNNLNGVIPAIVSRCSKHHIFGPTPEQLKFLFMSRLKSEGVTVTSTDALRLLTTALGHGCKQLSYRDVERLFKRTVYQCNQTLATW